MKIITWKNNCGFCLGNIIILPENYSDTTYKHEYGHHLQYVKYGFFKYYMTVAIPSVIGWWRDFLFHRKWTLQERRKWYYSQSWEAEADRLGGIIRYY